MSHDCNKSAYTWAWPKYSAEQGRVRPWVRYVQVSWPFYNLPDEEAATSRSKLFVAPVNNHYRRKVSQLISWREVLEANGYTIINRNRAAFQGLAGIRRDAIHGEIFYIYCVFHEERTSSLCLAPWGFHCFGCGASGHMVDFVAGINHLRTAQAIKCYIADTFPQMQPRTK